MLVHIGDAKMSQKGNDTYSTASKELHAFASFGIARSQRATDRSRWWKAKECRPHRTTIRMMIRRE